MKYGIMVVSQGVYGIINIGDYIQTLASRQFLPTVDVVLERETELKTYAGRGISMIMNGWYMNQPENWPPSEKIRPLLISFHINSVALPRMLDETSVAFFKRHQPVGCRDMSTVSLLRDKGVETYFSGCLTLTLGRTYKAARRTANTYIVDPAEFHGALKSKQGLIGLAYTLLHPRRVSLINAKKCQKGLRNTLYNAYFLYSYSKMFSIDLLMRSEYINHFNSEIDADYPSTEDKLRYAETLVRKYAEAQCVITSRIHCALPCLGLETPVLFVKKETDTVSSSMRFDGLTELLNVVPWDGKRLRNTFGKKKITSATFPVNKTTWKRYARDLTECCERFVNERPDA